MPHLCELKTAKIEFTLSISPSFVLHKHKKENDYFVLNRVSIFDTFFPPGCVSGLEEITNKLYCSCLLESGFVFIGFFANRTIIKPHSKNFKLYLILRLCHKIRNADMVETMPK